jgi:hypothetical protein
MRKPVGIFVFLALAVLATAAQAIADDRATTFQVVLKDERGKPVAGAEVYVLQCGLKAVDSAGPFKSDASGEARVEGLPPQQTFDQFLYARVPAQLVGVARRSRGPDDKAPEGPVALKMFESRELRGRVSVPAGFKAEDVTIRLLGFVADEDRGQDGPTLYYMEQSRDWLPQVFQCRANADGTFVLRDTPIRSGRYIGASARGLGEEQWSDRAVKAGEARREPSLKLREEAIIEGSAHFDGPESKPAPGLVIGARCYDRTEVVREYSAVVDKDGHYRITGLPGRNNNFQLVCNSFPDGWTSGGITNVRTNSGAVTGGVDVNLERGSVIRGRVVDTDGEPVAGADVSATNPPYGPVIGSAQSQADGAFAIRVPGGLSQLYFSGYPDKYDALPKRDDRERKISATTGEDQDGVIMRLRKAAAPERHDSKKGL